MTKIIRTPGGRVVPESVILAAEAAYATAPHARAVRDAILTAIDVWEDDGPCYAERDTARWESYYQGRDEGYYQGRDDVWREGSAEGLS